MSDTEQAALIDSAPAKKRRKMGKTRSDKGTKRKPDPTEREIALSYFASLDVPGKQRFIDDCSLILRFCDPAFVKAYNEYTPPKGPIITNENEPQ